MSSSSSSSTSSNPTNTKKRKAEVIKKTKKKKKKKDPNAPKGSKNGYMFFMASQREELVKTNPTDGIGDIVKKVGALWSKLSDKEKAPYAEMAAKDKIRYQTAQIEYEKTDDFKKFQATKTEPSSSVSQNNKKKKKKKRSGTSGWIEFGKEMRPGIKTANPEMAFGDITKALSTKWQAITKEETTIWNAKAKALNDARPPPESDSDNNNEDGDAHNINLIYSRDADGDITGYQQPPSKKRKTTKKKKDPNAPKRNKNGYMFYMAEKRESVVQANPTDGIGDIAKKVGALWSKLSDKEKAPYAEMAAKDKVRYEAAKTIYEQTEDFKKFAAASEEEKKKSKDTDGKKKRKKKRAEDGGDSSDEEDETHHAKMKFKLQTSIDGTYLTFNEKFLEDGELVTTEDEADATIFVGYGNNRMIDLLMIIEKDVTKSRSRSIRRDKKHIYMPHSVNSNVQNRLQLIQSKKKKKLWTVSLNTDKKLLKVNVDKKTIFSRATKETQSERFIKINVAMDVKKESGEDSDEEEEEEDEGVLLFGKKKSSKKKSIFDSDNSDEDEEEEEKEEAKEKKTIGKKRKATVVDSSEDSEVQYSSSDSDDGGWGGGDSEADEADAKELAEIEKKDNATRLAKEEEEDDDSN